MSAAAALSVDVGQVWEDCDYRSFWDATPAGEPCPPDYVGPVHGQPRRVEVVGFDDGRVVVRALHNGREAKIKRESFFASPHNDRNGRRRSQGFVLYEDVA